jgi:hypothetical protein
VINSFRRLLSFKNQFVAGRRKRKWFAILKFCKVGTKVNALLQAARERAK